MGMQCISLLMGSYSMFSENYGPLERQWRITYEDDIADILATKEEVAINPLKSALAIILKE